MYIHVCSRSILENHDSRQLFQDFAACVLHRCRLPAPRHKLNCLHLRSIGLPRSPWQCCQAFSRVSRMCCESQGIHTLRLTYCAAGLQQRWPCSCLCVPERVQRLASVHCLPATTLSSCRSAILGTMHCLGPRKEEEAPPPEDCGSAEERMSPSPRCFVEDGSVQPQKESLMQS